MVTRPQLSRIGLSLSPDAGNCIVRIQEADCLSLEKHLFQRYPHREWGTFFRFGFRRTAWGLAIYFVDALWPEPGDLNRQTALTTFHEDYSRRAFHESSNANGLAIGVVHSHPVGCPVFPSTLDDDMDIYFGSELASYGNGNPYCSLIFECNDQHELSISGRVFDRGQWLSVESLISVGERVDRFRSQLIPVLDVAEEQFNESTVARLKAVLGEAAEARLRNAIVGIIGCSGTGSPAIHALARAGIGNFIVVDPERLSASNLERLHGSNWQHLQLSEMPFKVELMREMIHSISPNAYVKTFVGNILHPNVVDELVRCDFVLGCTDTVHGRVALDELARHHLVPAIDVGVGMNGYNGAVTEQVISASAFGAGAPCVFCRGTINTYDMNFELMSGAERAAREQQADLAVERGLEADQYWKGRPRQLHTVGYLTSMAGAMVAGYVEGALTGCFTMPHLEMQFDMGQLGFGFVAPPEKCRPECICQSHLGWGDAANPYKNVVIPDHWSRRAVQLPDLSEMTPVTSQESA